ncbi:MAG TPA: MerR family transcriptional regulator [Candidatus Limnocylindria bacterium]|jgi:arsenate reductase
MNISTLARRAGISASGVRWYEAAGILPRPLREPNGYRLYTESDLSRLKLILTLRRLGLEPAAAGRLAERCLDGGALDPALALALDDQRRRIAEQREELERLEIELADLETTIDAAGHAPSRARRPISVLFVCNGNSARSQMAEALLGRFGGEDFRPLSGGTRPKSVHSLTVRVLAELGIDWSRARAKSVTELLDQPLDYVITLSNSAREECPAFLGRHSSLHWHLEDPAAVEGAEEERLAAFRATRAELSVRLRPFIEIARRAAGHLPAVAAPGTTVARGGTP